MMNEEKNFETGEKDLSPFSTEGFKVEADASEGEAAADGDISLFSAEENNDFIVENQGKSKGGKHARKKKGKPGKRRMKRWKKITLITVISILLVLVIAAGVLWFTAKRIYEENVLDKSFDAEKVDAVGIIDKDIVNIALFGIDTRSITSQNDNAYKGLSDSIMILSLNTQTKKVKVISVMRDSLVPIDELDSNENATGNKTYTKINAAYATGGPVLAVRTLNQIFKLDIRDYATVNFAGMADIIDAVGGIDVTLAQGELNAYGYENGHRVNWGFNGLMEEQCKLLGKDPSGLYINSAGTYHLNGIQAVAYARIRHAANVDGTNDDYGRTDRQRYVMEQLFNKAVGMKKSQYTSFAQSMLPCCKTSLEFEEVVGLAVKVLAASPTFEETRVPLTEYQMPNSGYVYYDLDFAKKLIHAFIYDDIKPEAYIEKNGVEKNDWYAQTAH